MIGMAKMQTLLALLLVLGCSVVAESKKHLRETTSDELRLLEDEDINFWGRELMDGSMPSEPIGAKYVSNTHACNDEMIWLLPALVAFFLE